MRNAEGLWRPSGLHAVLIYAARARHDRHLETLATYARLFRDEADKTSHELIDQIEASAQSGDLEAVLALVGPHFDVGRRTRRRKWRTGEGFVVVFLGPDGSGKTTLVEAVDSRLNPIKTTRTYLGMGQGSWCLNSVRRRYESNSSDLFVLLVGLPVELAVRRLRVIRGSRWRVVLVDRFPGFPYARPGLSHWYRAVLPKSDLTVLLVGDAQVRAARKSDTSIEEVERNAAKFRMVAEAQPGLMLEIDRTKMSVEEASMLVEEAIVSSTRFRARLLKSFNPTTPR